MKTVLGIGAHPDDLEIFCGGTLVRFFQEGWQTVMACVCAGDKGGTIKEKGLLAETRKKEAKAAAEIAGAQSIILGFPDSEIKPGKNLRFKIIDLIREVKPDVVITHFPEDYHADHNVVAAEVTSSIYISSSAGFKTKYKPVVSIPVLYYMETMAGVNFIPTEYVDITETMDKKAEMLKRHRSQFSNLKSRGGLDILELVQDTAKFRGHQSGVRYAEGFRACSCWPNFRTTRILP